MTDEIDEWLLQKAEDEYLERAALAKDGNGPDEDGESHTGKGN